MLENDKGVRKSFSLNELEDTDIKYLSELVSIASAAKQEKLQEEQLEAEKLAIKLENEDMWYVTLQARNGEVQTKSYFADNNVLATRMALRDYPGTRVLYAKKARNNRAFGRGGFSGSAIPIGVFSTPFVTGTSLTFK